MELAEKSRKLTEGLKSWIEITDRGWALEIAGLGEGALCRRMCRLESLMALPVRNMQVKIWWKSGAEPDF